MIKIEISGVAELRKRFGAFKPTFDRELKNTVQASLLTFWENTPPYPPPPKDSTYIRTGYLGRSLGSDIKGGKSGGHPDIYEVRQNGGYFEGTFGTRNKYAPYVIDDKKQAWMHRGRWWVIGDIAKRSAKKIDTLFRDFAQDMAEWLDGKRGNP